MCKTNKNKNKTETEIMNPGDAMIYILIWLLTFALMTAEPHEVRFPEYIGIIKFFIFLIAIFLTIKLKLWRKNENLKRNQS